MTARDAFTELQRIADAADAAGRQPLAALRELIREAARTAHAAEQIAAARPDLGVPAVLFSAMRGQLGLAMHAVELAEAAL